MNTDSLILSPFLTEGRTDGRKTDQQAEEEGGGELPGKATAFFFFFLTNKQSYKVVWLSMFWNVKKIIWLEGWNEFYFILI